MQRTKPSSGFRDSAIAAAWGRQENRIAAVVTVAVAVAVATISQIPLEPGFSLDLRVRSGYDLARSASFIGFEEPSERGRALDPHARVVLNRPLPRRFVLELEGSAPSESELLEVRVGSSRHRAAFGSDSGSHAIAVQNTAGAREIEFLRSRAGAGVTLLRIGIRAVGS
jgi:hypothetical protein